VLALVNDTSVNLDMLDHDAALNARAARNIIAHRNGADGVIESDDDDFFDTLAELDAVRYVGPYALGQLLAYAIEHGYLDAETGKSFDAIFSPQLYDNSHNVRIATIIDGAQHSLDIAMYSYSDAGIAAALEAAVGRGVAVRFIFETGNADRKLTGAALENSKSGRLERMGINVRYVNKIMHHKFMIADGPRDDASRADSATLVTGSGNWSWGAATRYDENTLFLTGYRELTLRLQNEFNLLWEHSRDVVVDADLPYEFSTYRFEGSAIPDELSSHGFFTSDNFTVNDTTFRITGKSTVSDALVGAIGAATDSIRIASGHLRSRPIAEALMAKAAADPDIDIRVYLDGQEYISLWYHNEQNVDFEACLVTATTESQIRNCTDKGFYFGYAIDEAGADVRYKYYSYRWHYSYAVQMHNKYMIIDGDELWTGSYNLSDNAEHNTFENMLRFRGPEFAGLVAAYVANFETMWTTGHGEGLLADLIDDVENSAVIPLVFDPMALTWEQVTNLKDRIRANCADINSEAFRSEPEKHWTCAR
jgi:phosphatidylserine/phosphatidylglycerophosphate/cardiolipin synthase-like enzyme